MPIPEDHTAKRNQRTVLVVDDDPAVLNSLKFSLEIEGYEVAAFASARDFFRAGPPVAACLVIDQNLAEVSGLDVVGELRRRGIGMAAVLITSYPAALLRQRAAAAAVPIVEKPLLGSTLVDTIRTLVERPH
jgi:FixJ family two-component response regulator